MEKVQSQQDTEQVSRSIEPYFQQDRSSRDSIDGNEIIRQHAEMKEKFIKIQEILNNSSLTDRNKVEETLQIIKESSKDKVSNAQEVIDVLRRSMQGQHIAPKTLNEKVETALRKMEELQNEKNQLKAVNIFMKEEFDKMAQEKKQLRQKLESLQTIIEQHKNQANNLRNSLNEYQIELEKKMSASERLENIQENKANAVVEKLKAEYEEALNKQKSNIERYQALLKAKSSRCIQLEQANSLLKKQNNNHVEEFRMKGLQLQQEKKKLEVINSKLEALEKENKKIKDMFEKCQTESSQVRGLQIKINELNGEIAKQRTELKKQEELAKENSILKEEIKAKNGQVYGIGLRYRDEINNQKDVIARLTQQYKQTQGEIIKLKEDNLKQEILNENSALKNEIISKNDQMFGLSLRHRDEINNQKQIITQLTNQYQQAKEKIIRLKAVSLPNELSELLPIIARVLRSPTRQEKQMKKKQISQAILFM